MNNFNLLVSTSRYNEINAEAEIWFCLLLCGDDYPIISKLDFPGLVIALTNKDPKKVIQELRKILENDPSFFQFILKIIPIDIVCYTNTNIIKELIRESYRKYIEEHETFRIVLNRRKHENIVRETFINTIASVIDNKVDLENPDKIVRIEILGNTCGIAFLKNGDILKLSAESPEEENSF
ncbi:MAG: THUMP domain-containing protein [Promethearchaeota archaeon]